MKTTSALSFLASSAALVGAQVTYDESTGKYTCDKANVAYCAGDSMKTDIIIRCNADKVGQPGRCTDNLAGEPPLGVNMALCYQPDATSGTAACEKECVVYGGSGNGNGTFTLSDEVCHPTGSASSTGSASYTAGPTYSSSASVPLSTGGPTQLTSSCTTTASFASGSTGVVSVPTNGTASVPPTATGGSGSGEGSATATPISPTKSTSTSTVPTGGAAVNGVSALAGLGLLVAYFL